jgi:hypothetical protein
LRVRPESSISKIIARSRSRNDCSAIASSRRSISSIVRRGGFCGTRGRRTRSIGFRLPTSTPLASRKEEDGFDLHDYLVKRSAVPKDKQDLVMVPENVVPVHHHCHMEAGQGKEMTKRCLYTAAMALGANDVGHWYVELWEEHGLSVRKGLLVPPKYVALSTAIRYFKAGCALKDIQLEQQPENDKVIGMAIQRWRGHLVANPKRYQDVPFPLVLDWHAVPINVVVIAHTKRTDGEGNKPGSMGFGVQGSLRSQMPRWFSHILHIVAGPDGKRFVVTQPTVSKGYRYWPRIATTR